MNPRHVAIGYVRASTADQRLGPEAQRAALAAWAASTATTIVEVHEETVSGRVPVARRPGLVAALAAIKVHRAGVLVAVRRDRFARDAAIASHLAALTRRAGAELLVVDGPGPGDSPEAKLMGALIDAVAEFEVGVLRARTSAALRAKVARGEAAGGCAPLGFTIEGGRLVPCPAEAAALARAAELRAAGLPWPRVTAILRTEKHRPRGRSWHAATLARALRSTSA